MARWHSARCRIAAPPITRTSSRWRRKKEFCCRCRLIPSFSSLFGNPIGLIFLLLGIFHTIGRFRRSGPAGDPAQTAASKRLGLGAAYIGILLVAAGGMSVANTALVNSNYVPGVNQSTGTTVL